MRVPGALIFVALAASCDGALPPAGQVALYFDTDAPVPQLFDELRVDVYAPGATDPCAACSRDFALQAGDFARRPISIGIPLPPGASGYRVRARLYPLRATRSGDVPLPSSDGRPPASVIDVIAALPAVGATGLLEQRVFLPTDQVGVPIGTLDAPVQTEAGAVKSSRVGTWTGAATVPCAGDPNPGEVCVPGGAFWMGNPKELSSAGPAYDASESRLVVLSPFFIRADAVTVAEARAVKVAAQLAWSGGTTGANGADFCTYTPSPGPFDDQPVNCLGTKRAAQLCKALGGALITEAQHEYVASARVGKRYPWGEDPATCDDAVYGRGGWGALALVDAPCMPVQPPGGPLVVGSKALAQKRKRRDRIELPTGTVYDLAGNMATWTLDAWNRQSEDCWNHGGVYVDPVCAGTSVDGAPQTERGGAWANAAASSAAMRATQEAPVGMVPISPFVGARCVRAGL